MTQLSFSKYSLNNGFTLVELVIVIVLLATLAITAAPKYIDITSDAKRAVMESVAGSMSSAIELVHSKAIVQNQLGASGQVQLSGNATPIDVVYGYPTMEYGNLNVQVDKLKQWMDIEIVSGLDVRQNPDNYPDDTFTLARSKVMIDAPDGGIQIFFSDAIKANKGSFFECVIQYTNATATQPAKVSTYLDAC